MRLPRGLTRRLRIYGGALLALALVKTLWFFAFRTDPERLLAGGERADLAARRAYLVRRLLADREGPKAMGNPGGIFEGEWFIGTLSMTTAALTNLAFDDPATRERAVEEIGRMIERALEEPARAFDRGMWRGRDALETLESPEGHAGYLGHLALMMGAHRLLGGDERFAARHRAVVAALARRMADSPSAHLETYPGEVYAMDNSVVAASLAVWDLATGESHRELLERWVRFSRERLLDPDTGAVAFSLTMEGQPTQRSRGSGVGWNSFYLPFVDPAFAQEQWAAIGAHFVAAPLGLTGLREHRHGIDAGGDVDSGPVLLGLSPSGTGFAIAGARRAGDARLLGGLLDTAELAGFTWQWGGERRYLLAPLVGDAIVLAMKTARPWDRSFLPEKASSRADPR